ncbi:MAG: hypothetical protein O7C75_00340, partial [Verrucomicrobia bacterium]|nr:hypothetical protein [Verrucomicrobiota bacterium]
MLPALLGTKMEEPVRDSIVHNTGNGTFALRKGPWKIIFGKGKERVQPAEDKGYLFNLRDDPYETTDLWSQHPELVEDLTLVLEKNRSASHSR